MCTTILNKVYRYLYIMFFSHFSSFLQLFLSVLSLYAFVISKFMKYFYKFHRLGVFEEKEHWGSWSWREGCRVAEIELRTRKWWVTNGFVFLFKLMSCTLGKYFIILIRNFLRFINLTHFSKFVSFVLSHLEGSFSLHNLDLWLKICIGCELLFSVFSDNIL